PGMVKKLQQEKNAFKAFPIKDSDCRISVDVQLIHKITNNVIGVVEGSDPSLQNQYIVVGGHYDHLGWGQEGSLYTGSEPMIHNGADGMAISSGGKVDHILPTRAREVFDVSGAGDTVIATLTAALADLIEARLVAAIHASEVPS
ncbi:MAG: M28 family peptidase, partial [Methylacidiphilales bacterium]|nr:M28 family peptidase [Candidatus Methylacidiphilales bacterium]